MKLMLQFVVNAVFVVAVTSSVGVVTVSADVNAVIFAAVSRYCCCCKRVYECRSNN
jgi:hypothetical protein